MDEQDKRRVGEEIEPGGRPKAPGRLDLLQRLEDSGRPITVSLAKDNLGKSLKTAIEAVSGKGAKIRSVNAAGLYPVIQFQE